MSLQRTTTRGHGKTAPVLPPAALDVIGTLAGIAHQDAEPNAKKASRRYGIALRTEYTRREEGPPVIRDAQRFLYRCANATRHLAGLMAAAKRTDVDNLTKAEAIALYRKTLSDEKRSEGEDSALDVVADCCWIKRAVATERDLAHDVLKAALCRRFAELHVTHAEVWA